MRTKAKPRRITPPTVQDGAETRRRLIAYLLDVVEDRKSDPLRRDRAAFRLARLIALEKSEQPPAVKDPKPRVSTYVGRKRMAEAESKTATKGSKWAALINGSEKRGIKH